MREDIAKTYITKKKSATMIHNPLGEITGSIFSKRVNVLSNIVEFLFIILLFAEYCKDVTIICNKLNKNCRKHNNFNLAGIFYGRN